MRYQPDELARTQIYLPSRRAARALSAAFLQQSHGAPLLLPKMHAIGDIDEDDSLIVSELGLPELGDMPPAIPQMRRLCLIARQVKSFPIGGQRPTDAQAFALAGALIQLGDQVQNAEFDVAEMADLWPKELAAHWQDIAQFLSIMWQFWPQILEAEQAMDPVARRIALMERQAALWQANPPTYPVIIAGSTGTLPATQKLMKAVATLPQGQIIFPGMIPDLSDDDWQAICADKVHPLHPTSVTLSALSVRHDDIALWPESAAKLDAVLPRIHFMKEVMRPASQTEKWRALGSGDEALMGQHSFTGFRRLEAQDAHEEAALIALAMRHCLEVPEKTAILVTADRQLARMVQSELRRFDIEIDDSAGEPLLQTSLGTYLMLLSRLFQSTDFISDLMALADHPLSAGGCDRVIFREMVSTLNRHHLRGALPFRDGAGLISHLASTPELQQFVAEHLLAPLAPIMAAKQDTSLSETASLLGQVAEAFAATDNDDVAAAVSKLWSGPSGVAAAKALRELSLHGTDFPISHEGFAAILREVLANIDVRQPFQKQSRLAILGAVESRMISADLVILSGLNEGIWPPKANQDLWMNQAMAEAMGLPHKQWRIALSAHDFMMAACMPEVLITRARRTAEGLALPSRWLTRMDAVMTALKISDLIAPRLPDDLAEIMAYRTKMTPTPIAPPAPCPPVSLRPTQFSATQFDTLISDPYAIYAKRILGLRALAPVNEAPNAALKGTLFHQALQLFTQAHPTGQITDEHLAIMLELAQPLFQPWLSHYEVQHFWWPQFIAVAQWFLSADNDMRQSGDLSFAEVQGEVEINLGARHATITAKADRIVLHDDGSVTIIDYKTGAMPSQRDVTLGRSTQMLVEAGLIAKGGYQTIAKGGTIRALHYWKLHGRGQEAGDIKNVVPKEFDEHSLLDTITNLLIRFEQQDMPYHAEPDARATQRYSDYRHLARIKEWRVLEVKND